MEPKDPLSFKRNDLDKPRFDDKPLSEEDFIQNGWSLRSIPFWLWITLMIVLGALIWGGKDWYQSFVKEQQKDDPFLHVTNREFSLFLWQFPSFMRVNAPQQSGYLTGFSIDTVNFKSATADEYVSAPPDLIFLYHTWDRLLSEEFIPRPISPDEFEEFLELIPEWQPQNWKHAPQDYAMMIQSKNYAQMTNLQTLPETALPKAVRQAFQGWKNYFKEGTAINEFFPTINQVQSFLQKHPHYARQYWRNIATVEDQPVAGHNYLAFSLMHQGTTDPQELLPKEQLSSFLKVALFNDQQAQKGL